MSELDMYMTTHKEVPKPADPYYKTLHCGAEGSTLNLGGLRDDLGDNISSRNRHYSEMTGHYWIWKNSQAKHVGLVHYRRFFAARHDSFIHNGQSVATGEDILAQLTTNDLIAVHPLTFFHENTMIPCPVECQYVGSVHGFDLIPIRRLVGDLDSSYLPAFDFVMRNHKLIAFNMVVTKKQIFDEYSAWLFAVLLAFENEMSYSSLEEGYFARVPAFLAERLFTVWIGHNRTRLKLAYRAYIWYDDL